MVAGVMKRLARRAGVEIGHYRPYGPRRTRRLLEAGVATVLDVGANAGQFGAELRAQGFPRRIVSLEPLAEPFSKLSALASTDDLWDCLNVAASSRDGTAELNVASNYASSSFLRMRAEHADGAPTVTVVGTEHVTVRRLDSLEIELETPIFLKMDVQGYEAEVIAGAPRTLAACVLVECELALGQLYEGQSSIRDMITLLGDAGFEMVDLDPFFYDGRDGRILAVDALFTSRA